MIGELLWSERHPHSSGFSFLVMFSGIFWISGVRLQSFFSAMAAGMTGLSNEWGDFGAGADRCQAVPSVA